MPSDNNLELIVSFSFVSSCDKWILQNRHKRTHVARIFRINLQMLKIITNRWQLLSVSSARIIGNLDSFVLCSTRLHIYIFKLRYRYDQFSSSQLLLIYIQRREKVFSTNKNARELIEFIWKIYTRHYFHSFSSVRHLSGIVQLILKWHCSVINNKNNSDAYENNNVMILITIGMAMQKIRVVSLTKLILVSCVHRHLVRNWRIRLMKKENENNK